MDLYIGDYVLLPPNPVSVRIRDLDLYFGTNQDRTSDRLFAYSKEQQRDNIIFTVYTFKRLSRKFKVVNTGIYYHTKDISTFFTIYNLVSIVNFIDGKLPFYIENGSLWNRQHQSICTITPEFGVLLLASIPIVISPSKCLFLRSNTSITLFYDDKIAVLQSSRVKQFHSDAIVVDNVLFTNFQITQAMIDQLKKIETLEEAIVYLKREMTFNAL
jgi:hypothetical protein